MWNGPSRYFADRRHARRRRLPPLPRVAAIKQCYLHEENFPEAIAAFEQALDLVRRATGCSKI